MRRTTAATTAVDKRREANAIIMGVLVSRGSVSEREWRVSEREWVPVLVIEAYVPLRTVTVQLRLIQ
eukprot:scaffold257050_cov50-Attheya_sp.AAC.2